MAEGGTKLNEDQLYQCLKSLYVPVRLSDLKAPTRDFVIQVFECFLKDLQIDIYSSKLRPWNAIGHIDHMEMYERAQNLLLLTSSISQVMEPLGLSISIRDINEPKPKRTKKILNYLIIFWNYYLKKYSRFEIIEQNMQQEMEMAENLVKENAVLDDKIQQYCFKIQNSSPSKEELIQLVSAKANEIEDFNRKKEQLSLDYQNLKKKEHAVASEISTADIDIASVKEIINELDEVILSSPEKLGVDLERVKEQLKDVENKMAEKENEMKEKKKSLANIALTLKSNEKDLEALQAIQDVMSQNVEVVKSILNKEKEFEEEEDKVKKLQEELNMKGDVKNYYEHKAAQARMFTSQKKEAFNETLQKLDRQIEEERKRGESHKKLILKSKEELEKVEAELREKFCQQMNIQEEVREKTKEFEAEANTIVASFQKDCLELKDAAEEAFGKREI